MSGTGPIIDFRCDSMLNRPCIQPRRVEPICPPPDCVVPLGPAALRRLALVDADITCLRDCFERVPFHRFLERQNQEFYAAVDRELALRRPAFEPAPCPPADRCPAPQVPASARPAPARPEPAEPSTPAPSTSAWPHIGDVAPVPPHPRPDRLRTIQQFLPPQRPGRITDLLL